MDKDALYQEGMYVAKLYDIPKVIVDDFYAAFVEFVREEVNKRIKTGVATRINPDVFIMVLMSEANIG